MGVEICSSFERIEVLMLVIGLTMYLASLTEHVCTGFRQCELQFLKNL